MSRTYRKNIVTFWDGFPPLWGKIRTKEKELLHKEVFAFCHDDTMFPHSCKAKDYFKASFPLSLLISKIRNEYYTEINHIFNDFSVGITSHSNQKKIAYYKKSFLEIVKRIKQLPIIQYDKNKYANEEKSRWFEWLCNKEILKVIEQWEGDPLDSLFYLSRHGYIEKAVRKRENFIRSTGHRFIHKGGVGSFWPGAANDRPIQKRTEKRKASIENQGRKKEEKIEIESKTKNTQIFTKQLLQKDNKTKMRKTKRRPEKFIALFSFMISEGQLAACLNWRAHSFNERKQSIEFIRSCIFPYAIPEPLIFASILPNQVIDNEGKWRHSPDYDAIMMSRKWLLDIVSGNSFYEQNKNLFTRAESHYFLVSKIEYYAPSSVFELYFYAKCKARALGLTLSAIVTRIFSVKFAKYLQSPLITEFLDFIARNKDYPFSYNEMVDISDFILSKIIHYQTFSFSGRTIGSLSVLANEWHMDEQRRMTISKNSNAKVWKGLSIPYFSYETDDTLWEIKQLCSIDDLFREGQIMKHCVASAYYVKSCAMGNYGIFNVSCINNFNKKCGKVISHATIEVSRNKTIIQVRGKCNRPVGKKVMKIIKLWANNNKIKLV
jgi:hypothetical protein